LEIQNENGTWGTICAIGFGQAEADVACRQLGYDEKNCRDGNNDYDTNNDDCDETGHKVLRNK